jgi:polyhydroxybutyrate depolymerase
MRLRRAHLAVPPAALAALLGVALAGLGGSAPKPAPAPVKASSACSVRPGTTVRISVAVEGQGTRSALVHVPKARHGRVPLILALHGAFGSGAFMERYSGLSRLGDQEGFGVVYPDAAGSYWRISAGEKEADVEFLDAALDQVLAGGCFDPGRVSAVGVSNGGGMAARFACAGDDRLAGVVAVAGGYGSLPPCSARRAISVLEIHGTADTVVPYRGTAKYRRGDVMQWLGEWVSHDACPRAVRRTQRAANVLRLDWGPCRGGTAVAHLRLVGGTHAWPGADPPDPGPVFGVSASEEAWAFLRGRRLAQDDDG